MPTPGSSTPGFLFGSEHAETSPWVEKEWSVLAKRMIEEKRRLFVVRLDGTELGDGKRPARALAHAWSTVREDRQRRTEAGERLEPEYATPPPCTPAPTTPSSTPLPRLFPVLPDRSSTTRPSPPSRWGSWWGGERSSGASVGRFERARA